jgi:hypothetical protein
MSPPLSVDEILRIARESEERIARAHAEIDASRAKPEMDVDLPDRFPRSRFLTLDQFRCGSDSDLAYAWIHVDDEGRPFYAGYGMGTSAWDPQQSSTWTDMVTRVLGGCYHVVVPATPRSMVQLEWLYNRILERYAGDLLVYANMHRSYGGDDAAEYQQLHSALKPLFDVVRSRLSSRDYPGALAACQDAVAIQRKMVGLQSDPSRFAELSKGTASNVSGPAFFMVPLIEELVATGRVEEARAELKAHADAIKGFDKTTPYPRLLRICERGAYKRRTPKID